MPTDYQDWDEELKEIQGLYLYHGKLVAKTADGNMVTLKANVMGQIVVDNRF